MGKLSENEERSLGQLNKISGTGGFKALEAATAYTGLSGYAIVTLEDCDFTVFSIDGTNQYTSLGLNVVTIPSGTYLPVKDGSVITAVTSTGRCIIYNL